MARALRIATGPGLRASRYESRIWGDVIEGTYTSTRAERGETQTGARKLTRTKS